MRILLTGARGQVGRCFRDRLPDNWELIAADSQTLDITDRQAVLNMVQNFEPDAIINAAAYSNLFAAESDVDRTFEVNSIGTRNLADAACLTRTKFIHLSTDYVFDGTKRTPYTEDDAPRPQSVYAQSKLAGELIALAINAQALVIRTAWMFSEYGGNNFVRSILQQAQEYTQFDVVNDQIGCPTYAGDVAELLIDLSRAPELPRGIFHYCGEKIVSRYEFAQEIKKLMGFQAYLNPISTPIDASVNRPLYSALNCDKIRDLGYRQPDWQKSLAQMLPRLVENLNQYDITPDYSLS